MAVLLQAGIQRTEAQNPIYLLIDSTTIFGVVTARQILF